MAKLKKCSRTKQKEVAINSIKEIFEKYANLYDEKGREQVELQYQVYIKLKEKGIKETNIEKYLELLIDDIHHQYSVKQDLENKTGFILALWGVLLSTVIQLNLPQTMLCVIFSNEYGLLIRTIYGFNFSGLIVSGLLSILFIVKTLLDNKFYKFLYNDKCKHFMCLVDDKCLSMVNLLDTNTNVWIKNERTIKNKSTDFKISLFLTGILIFFVILSSFINVYGG